MSTKFQAVLVNDPECFVKPLPSMRLTTGTSVSADDDQYVVLGFTADYAENPIFKLVPAEGIYGARFEAIRPCTLMYSGALFRDNATARGALSITQGDLSTDYGQISPTVFSTGIAAPAGENLFDVAGIATLLPGEAISFLLDNGSVDVVLASMTITSVNPA